MKKKSVIIVVVVALLVVVGGGAGVMVHNNQVRAAQAEQDKKAAAAYEKLTDEATAAVDTAYATRAAEDISTADKKVAQLKKAERTPLNERLASLKKMLAKIKITGDALATAGKSKTEADVNAAQKLIDEMTEQLLQMDKSTAQTSLDEIKNVMAKEKEQAAAAAKAKADAAAKEKADADAKAKADAEAATAKAQADADAKAASDAQASTTASNHLSEAGAIAKAAAYYQSSGAVVGALSFENAKANSYYVDGGTNFFHILGFVAGDSRPAIAFDVNYETGAVNDSVLFFPGGVQSKPVGN